MNEQHQKFNDHIKARVKEEEKRVANIKTMCASEINDIRDEVYNEWSKVDTYYTSLKATERAIRHEKRLELLKEYSHSKTEQILRADNDLELMAFKLILLAGLRRKLNGDLDMLKNAYFGAKV